MNYQNVVPVHTRVSSSFAPMTDTFEFRRDRKFHWLQRLAIWMLRKLKCNAFRETEHVSRIAIDTNKVIQCLHEQDCELISRYNLRGDRVLMGSEDYKNLTKETFDIKYPMSFVA